MQEKLLQLIRIARYQGWTSEHLAEAIMELIAKPRTRSSAARKPAARKPRAKA
jgi:hypothetical protein